MATDPPVTITKIDVALTPDRRELVQTYHVSNDDPFFCRTETPGIEEQINTLGMLRSAMVPPIPPTWTPAPLNATRDPAWSIGSDRLAGDALVHLRDPWFGWRHFIFTREEARRLAAAILAECDKPAPTTAGSA